MGEGETLTHFSTEWREKTQREEGVRKGEMGRGTEEKILLSLYVLFYISLLYNDTLFRQWQY